jgi:hypothetical protein
MSYDKNIILQRHIVYNTMFYYEVVLIKNRDNFTLQYISGTNRIPTGQGRSRIRIATLRLWLESICILQHKTLGEQKLIYSGSLRRYTKPTCADTHTQQNMGSGQTASRHVHLLRGE